MKIRKIEPVRTAGNVAVTDTFAGDGYRQGPGGLLPDVDIDFQSDRRQEVKEYLEQRYNTEGRRQVFSAGTLTTLKMKAVLKDVCRVHRVPVGVVNYITAIFEDDNMSWTDLFRLAATNKKVRDFIQRYPQVIEDIRPLMGQPRSASVHASAIIITPKEQDGETMECFDYTPIRKTDELLISELDGYSIDEVGLLKNDCLGIKELSKIQAVLDICNREYEAGLTFEGLVRSRLDDEKTYRLLSEGYTQNVFQFASRGMTRFLQDMRPERIDDLIAANALYRPATLESGSAEKFLLGRRGEVAPVYLWGTHEALKETYATLVYQESLAQMAREVGGFSLAEGVRLLKLISKKKISEIHALKEKFMSGAAAKGCPREDATRIWEMIEAGGGYLFNKCISGNEIIYRPHGGRWQPTIAEMYRIRNEREYARRSGHLNLHFKYIRQGYGIAFSLDEEKSLVKNRIVDIRYAGVRPVYRITLENGMRLEVTANHTHPTPRGKLRTDELVAGEDRLYVNAGYCQRNTSYRFTDKGSVNDQRYHSNAQIARFRLNSRPGRMGFLPRPNSEYVKLKHYREHLMADHCEWCGATGGRLEIHHKDGCHGYCGTNYENLVTLCVSCHKKEHYRMGRTKMGEAGLATDISIVRQVECIGEEAVYDVEMEAPYHTFVTDGGVVTCNSHATAYAVTSYVGAYLKANYPTAFYTVALQWADDKEIPLLMSEMELCSNARIVPPEINTSRQEFFTNYQTDEIFWSLSRIKQLGAKAVAYIVEERTKNGPYDSVEHFIHRIFKYKLKKYAYWDDPDDAEEAVRVPVNARHVRNMILGGCFDKVAGIDAVSGRYGLLEIAARELGFSLSEQEFPPEKVIKHYFWSQQQVAVSGIGSIDYRRIFEGSQARPAFKGKASYLSLREVLDPESDGRRAAVCATVADLVEASYKDKTTGERKKFVKLTLQQNNDVAELVCWNDFYAAHHDRIASLKDRIVIVSAMVRYSDYNGGNSLQSYKSSILFIV